MKAVLLIYCLKLFRHLHHLYFSGRHHCVACDRLILMHSTNELALLGPTGKYYKIFLRILYNPLMLLSLLCSKILHLILFPSLFILLYLILLVLLVKILPF